MKENPHKKDSIENENKLENESCKNVCPKTNNENHLNRNQWQGVFYRTVEFALKKAIFKVLHKKLLSSTSGERNKIRLHPTAMKTEKLLP